jgi:hypothetical protein
MSSICLKIHQAARTSHISSPVTSPSGFRRSGSLFRHSEQRGCSSGRSGAQRDADRLTISIFGAPVGITVSVALPLAVLTANDHVSGAGIFARGARSRIPTDKEVLASLDVLW